jgi:hypothetical protein
MTEQITETGDVSTDRNTESVSTESRTSDVGSSSDNTDDADDDLQPQLKVPRRSWIRSPARMW